MRFNEYLPCGSRPEEERSLSIPRTEMSEMDKGLYAPQREVQPWAACMPDFIILFR